MSLLRLANPSPDVTHTSKAVPVSLGARLNPQQPQLSDERGNMHQSSNPSPSLESHWEIDTLDDLGLSDDASDSNNLLSPSTDHGPEPEPSRTSMFGFLSSVHYQSLVQIQQRALPHLFGQNSVSSHSFTPDMVTARLSLFLICTMDYLRGKSQQNSEVLTTEPDQWGEIAIACLQAFGWSVKRLQLKPPTKEFSAISSHSFWLVRPPIGVLDPRMHEAEVCQFVIDFNFKSLFIVARPTEAYAHALANELLRDDFVGTIRDLCGAVRVFSIEAKASLEAQEMAIPPWRRSHFLESCFVQAIQLSSRSRAVNDFSEDTAVKMVWFLKSYPVLLKLVALSPTNVSNDLPSTRITSFPEESEEYFPGN